MIQRVPIGEAGRHGGVTIPTICSYDKIGLLPPPARSESHRRHDEGSNLRRAGFIRHAQVALADVDQGMQSRPGWTWPRD